MPSLSSSSTVRMPAMPLPATTRRVRFDVARRLDAARVRPSTRVGIGGDVEGRILDAAPAGQREVMLVDRRRDHALALQVADQAARQHIGAARRIEVVERVDAPVNLEQRDLPPADERGHAGAFDEVLERADVVPACVAHAATSAGLLALGDSLGVFGAGGTNLAALLDEHHVVVGLVRFTKVRKRLSVSGSSTATFHSQA